MGHGKDYEQDEEDDISISFRSGVSSLTQSTATLPSTLPSISRQQSVSRQQSSLLSSSRRGLSAFRRTSRSDPTHNKKSSSSSTPLLQQQQEEQPQPKLQYRPEVPPAVDLPVPKTIVSSMGTVLDPEEAAFRIRILEVREVSPNTTLESQVDARDHYGEQPPNKKNGKQRWVTAFASNSVNYYQLYSSRRGSQRIFSFQYSNTQGNPIRSGSRVGTTLVSKTSQPAAAATTTTTAATTTTTT